MNKSSLLCLALLTILKVGLFSHIEMYLNDNDYLVFKGHVYVHGIFSILFLDLDCECFYYGTMWKAECSSRNNGGMDLIIVRKR